MSGSSCLPHATIPPCTCTASEKPAFLTTASASAERTPDLQCSTDGLSCGNLGQRLAGQDAALGDQLAPGMLTISYSFCSRTSISAKSLARVDHLLELARGDRVVGRGLCASSDTTPQNAS